MEIDQASVLSVKRAILGYGNANAMCALEPYPSIDTRLESGDIVEIIEGDVDVVTDGGGRSSRRSVPLELKRSKSSSPLSLFTAVHPHRRSCFLLVGTCVPPLIYQMWCWLELMAPL